MSVNIKSNGELVTVASGQRIWVGTKQAWNNLQDKPTNCLKAIIDDGAGEAQYPKVASYFLGQSYTTFTLKLYNPTENSGMLLINATGKIFNGTINFLHQGSFTDGTNTYTCTYNPDTGIATFSGPAAINDMSLWYH